MDELAALVSEPGLSPTEPEIIVVQSKGLERWVAMELSRRLGVWANAVFPFPRNFVERALGAVLGTPATAQPRFSPERMVWSLAALLPALSQHGELGEVRSSLGSGGQVARRVELASQIADVFDQYPVYRPDRVLAWEAGEADAVEGWQAVAWRALIERDGTPHLARRAADFAAAIAKGEAVRGRLPCRVSLFGVGALPPLFVDIFAALAEVIEVHLFVLSPSREHWAYIRSKRELAREARARRDDTLNDEALSIAVGNPLLASLGRLGRDFQFVLESRVEYRESDRDLYVEPPASAAKSMLATLQGDILALRHRRAGAAEVPPLAIDPGDRSLQVHVCHGPMREVEVLRDQILGLLHADRTIEPRDVIVMTPDLATYGPLVEAIFGGDTKEAGALPFRIADRGLRDESPAADAFFALLDVATGRITASAVLDLLAREGVREKFGIGEDELDTVRDWVVASNVRWGVDAAHRTTFQQPPFKETTWRFGLDRLLLGYAMPGDDRVLFGETLPFDDVEGGEAELLGRFAAFCEALFEVRSGLAEERSIAGWRDALTAAMDRMLAEPERGDELQDIREALAEMTEAAEAAGFGEAVPLHVVRSRLDVSAAAPGGHHAFLSGGITVCALLPMRSIPFRVVCLLGMNDGTFPRVKRTPSFDLVAQRPRRGDRSARDEDRYLFLEAILSARSHLLLTHVGRSVKENAEIPPSVVVSELLDVLDESFVGGVPEAARRHVVVVHPLQPFSPAYFRPGADARVFSYSARFCAGARALLGPRDAPPPLFRRRLPPPEEADAAVTLDQLTTFFTQPMRALLRDRLDLRLDESAIDILDREPMELSGLDEYKLGADLLRRALDGDDLQGAYELVRARGVLPLGNVGFCRYQDALPEVDEMAAVVRGYVAGGPLPPRELDLVIGGERLTGWLRDLFPEARVQYGFGSAKASSELALWIRHLALQCVAAEGVPRASVLIARERSRRRAKVIRFGEVAASRARELLGELLRWYRVGQMVPLCFFPEASRAYAAAKHDGKDDDKAVAEARAKFDPSGDFSGAPSEADEPHVARVLDGRDPIDPGFRLFPAPAAGEPEEPSFAELSEAIFTPLLRARGDEEGA